MMARVSPGFTVRPSATAIFCTLPFFGDLSSFCIFIASMTITPSPSATSAPTAREDANDLAGHGGGDLHRARLRWPRLRGGSGASADRERRPSIFLPRRSSIRVPESADSRHGMCSYAVANDLYDARVRGRRHRSVLPAPRPMLRKKLRIALGDFDAAASVPAISISRIIASPRRAPRFFQAEPAAGATVARGNCSGRRSGRLCSAAAITAAVVSSSPVAAVLAGERAGSEQAVEVSGIDVRGAEVRVAQDAAEEVEIGLDAADEVFIERAEHALDRHLTRGRVGDQLREHGVIVEGTDQPS